ncbi:hypothetical protein [Dysgonomonas termitidis]|uniref:RDD domain-containing protein n=1 Tax=Dysgonomonas termitidis TaxID=1516126 RepID=A0ABV9KUL0_9BACT
MERLTEHDIKIIRDEMRIGFIFSSLFLFADLLFNFVYYIEYGIDICLILVNIGILSLCILIPFFMNKNYRKDLDAGEKIVELGKIQIKECKKSYEAGSGNLYIPILGNLFPKLWGSQPRLSLLCYLVINNVRYKVDDDFYNKVNEEEIIKMYFTIHSHMMIGFEQNIHS